MVKWVACCKVNVLRMTTNLQLDQKQGVVGLVRITLVGFRCSSKLWHCSGRSYLSCKLQCNEKLQWRSGWCHRYLASEGLHKIRIPYPKKVKHRARWVECLAIRLPLVNGRQSIRLAWCILVALVSIYIANLKNGQGQVGMPIYGEYFWIIHNWFGWDVLFFHKLGPIPSIRDLGVSIGNCSRINYCPACRNACGTNKKMLVFNLDKLEILERERIVTNPLENFQRRICRIPLGGITTTSGCWCHLVNTRVHFTIAKCHSHKVLPIYCGSLHVSGTLS